MSEKVQIARAILLLDQISEFLLATGGDQAAALSREATAMARTLRHHTEDIEKLIRDCAAKGMGKLDTQETLGISRYRFELLVSVMPDIQWVQSNQTSGRRRYYESVRGIPRGKVSTEAAVAASVEARRIYSICGVQGTVRELHNLWKQHCDIGYSTVNRRLAQGENIYDAFFGKRRQSAVETKMTPTKKAAFAGIHRSNKA